MKNYLFLLTALMSLLATSSFAGGGVDVGNGTSHTVLFHTPSFGTEALLERKLTETVSELQKNQNPSFNSVVSSGECDEKVKIGEIDQEIAFKVKGNSLSLKKLYQGVIKVNLKDCQKAYLLPETFGRKQ